MAIAAAQRAAQHAATAATEAKARADQRDARRLFKKRIEHESADQARLAAAHRKVNVDRQVQAAHEREKQVEEWREYDKKHQNTLAMRMVHSANAASRVKWNEDLTRKKLEEWKRAEVLRESAEAKEQQQRNLELAEETKIEQRVANNHKADMRRRKAACNAATSAQQAKERKDKEHYANERDADEKRKRDMADAIRKEAMAVRSARRLAEENRRAQHKSNLARTLLEKEIAAKAEEEQRLAAAAWRKRLADMPHHRPQSAPVFEIRKRDTHVQANRKRPATARGLRPGDRVKITGLILGKMREFNDAFGTVMYWMEKDERWLVDMELGGTIKLKVANMIYVGGRRRNPYKSQQQQLEMEKEARRRWKKATGMARLMARMNEKNTKRRMPKQQDGEILLFEDWDTQVFKKRTRPQLVFVMSSIRNDRPGVRKKIAVAASRMSGAGRSAFITGPNQS